MWNRLILVAAPGVTPVSLLEAKAHLRVDFNDEDTLISLCIDKAVAAIDGPFGIGRCMVTQSWLLSLDCFPEYEICIPLGPVASITSIKYLDSAGVEQTLAPSSYWPSLKCEPATVSPAYGATWPIHRAMPGSVKIEFVAGTAAASVPADLRAAVLLLIGHYYDHRAAAAEGQMSELPIGVEAILNRYRSGRVA